MVAATMNAAIQIAAQVAAQALLLLHDGDALLAGCRALSLRAASLALAAVWQGALIASLLAFCLRFLPRVSAAGRFAVWTAAFVALIALPLLGPLAALLSAPGDVASAAAQSATAPWLRLDARWSLPIAALWAALSLYRSINLAVHSLRLSRFWKHAQLAALDPSLSSLPASIDSRRPVQVCTTTALERPSVIGFFRPRILIPDWLFDRLTPAELRQIVLHEAEHLRRGDDWTNLFQKLALVLFPLNPALIWIERRLCREREMACDEAVVEATRQPRAYAACLAGLAERGLERTLRCPRQALSLGAWQRRPELVHRVHSILRCGPRLSPLAARILLSGLGCALLVGSVELSRCPQIVAFVSAPTSSTPQASLLSAAAAPAPLPIAARFTPAANREERALKGHGFSRAATASRSVSGFRHEGKSLVNTDIYYVQPARGIQTGAASLTSHQQLDRNPQWIVLTTFEEVESAGPAPVLTADYEDSGQSSEVNDANKAGEKSQKTSQPTGKITLTRLIVRVFPANSISAPSVIAPTRAGWLVLQL